MKTVSGSYAEFSVADECHTFRLHDDLTFSQGAALGIPYFTAYRALVLRSVCNVQSRSRTGHSILHSVSCSGP